MLPAAETLAMSDTPINTTRIVLASRPQGAPTDASFRLEQAPLPALQPGEVLLRNRYLSLDPYMRGRMDDGPSYAAPVALGAVMEGQTVSEVLQSTVADVAVGDHVLAPGGWQTHAVLPAAALGRRLDVAGLPLSMALGVFGMPGFTAYSSLHEIARLKPGETLVVAAASGPVGATVAQLARLQGARVVAIAGGAAKQAYLHTLGVDVALDHRAPDFAAQLRDAVPDGIAGWHRRLLRERRRPCIGRGAASPQRFRACSGLRHHRHLQRTRCRATGSGQVASTVQPDPAPAADRARLHRA